jgi:hypothetical protein
MVHMQEKINGRPRCKWDYNIKTHLKEIGCGAVDAVCVVCIGNVGGCL